MEFYAPRCEHLDHCMYCQTHIDVLTETLACTVRDVQGRLAVAIEHLMGTVELCDAGLSPHVQGASWEETSHREMVLHLARRFLRHEVEV
jgi:hypothetical protein